MPQSLARAYVIEFVGTFGLVYVSAAAVIMNYLATPENQPLGTSPLNIQQTGVVGVALAQGLIYAVLLWLTAARGGGYLNPALAVALWGFNRLESRRLAWLLGAQLLASFVAGACLRLTFDLDLLRTTQFGAPHVNLQAYKELNQATRIAGAGVELVLTFFLTFAIFAAGATRPRDPRTGAGPLGEERPQEAAWAAGAVQTAAVVVAFSLTGAALNPARWFGPVVWDAWMGRPGAVSPFADALVYLAGPILGALLGGGFCFWIYRPEKS